MSNLTEIKARLAACQLPMRIYGMAAMPPGQANFIGYSHRDLAWAVHRIEELEAVLLSCLNGMNSDNPVWKRAAKLLEGE